MRPVQLLSRSAVVLALVAMGCGGGAESEPDAMGTTDTDAAAVSEPIGSAAISGNVRFTGTAPERSEIKQDRECSALRDAPPHTQHVVVNDNGTLRYVFVYVKEGLGDRTFAAPKEPVVIDQKGCMYEPHVFGIQVGQPLKILNSDPLLHNIHALAEENRPFNFGMPNAGAEREQTFRTPEVMVRIKCDVHPWMLSFAGVVSHPYHSVTGEDGTFSLDGLPAGTYVIEAWHEEYGTTTQNVTVADGETASVDFSFGAGA